MAPRKLRVPDPVYKSYADYRSKMSGTQLRKKLNEHARTARNRYGCQTSGFDVWQVFVQAKGRCAYCGSLAVEAKPISKAGKAKRWKSIGRRIGSFDHVKNERRLSILAQFRAGKRRIALDPNPKLLFAWSCLTCNASSNEPHLKRQRGATDHGGFYPNEPSTIFNDDLGLKKGPHITKPRECISRELADAILLEIIYQLQEHMLGVEEDDTVPILTREAIADEYGHRSLGSRRETAEWLVEMDEEFQDADFDYCIDEDYLYDGPTIGGGRH